MVTMWAVWSLCSLVCSQCGRLCDQCGRSVATLVSVVTVWSLRGHCGHSVVSRRLRTAGVRGLQGVVRKTVTDDLQVNIWEKTHMDKIVPSLLYNMQVNR